MKEKAKLIFIPGLLCDETLWQPVIEGLQDLYWCECVSVAEGSSIEEIAAKINLISDKNTVLIGFSFGAWVALQACLAKPDFYKGLVLISSAPGNLKPEVKQRFANYILHINQGGFENFVQEDLEKDVFNKDAALKKLMAMKLSKSPELAVKQLTMMVNFNGDFSAVFEMETPLLLVRGAQDESLNIEKQEAILQAAKNAALEIIPHAGHYVPLENPKSLIRSIKNWLV